MNTTDRDMERAKAHDETGKSAFEAIKEMVENLPDWQKAAEAEGWTGPHKDKFGATYFDCESDDVLLSGPTKWACGSWRELCLAHDIEPDERSEDAEQMIHEDPLSVLVRDGWREPGGHTDEGPEEYEILLSTGGPATRIRRRAGRLRAKDRAPRGARLVRALEGMAR